VIRHSLAVGLEVRITVPAHRLGIFGGSFNPIHNGHLQIAKTVFARHRLDRVLLLPARQPPHKSQDLASAEHRLAMTRLACEGEPGLEACDLELTGEGPNYTADTLDELARLYEEAELFFVMGADSLLDFPGWRDPHRVLARARVVVVNRPGFEIRWRAEFFPDFSEAVLLRIKRDQVKMPPSTIQSTEIRKAIRAGTVRSGAGLPCGGVGDLVPTQVARYIDETGLYRAEGPSTDGK
jgi:nicotinate-nucleotide adenylyltransferase